VRAARTVSTYGPSRLEIARESTHLDFRGDPADELIAGHGPGPPQPPLVTRDREIRRSRLVPLAH